MTASPALDHIALTVPNLDDQIERLATAYRLPCEHEARGGEPVGWQRWRRQLLEQTRDKVIVCAQGYDGIFHLAEYSLLLGVKLKDVPPGIGTHQEILAKYQLTMRS